MFFESQIIAAFPSWRSGQQGAASLPTAGMLLIVGGKGGDNPKGWKLGQGVGMEMDLHRSGTVLKIGLLASVVDLEE